MRMQTIMDAIVAMDAAKTSLYRYEADSFHSRANIADALVSASVMLKAAVAHLSVEVKK
jgi:hypothetical protein